MMERIVIFPPSLHPDEAFALFVGRTISHFTDLVGVTGIIGPRVASLMGRQALVATQAFFRTGVNHYLAYEAGEIFITDLPIDASSRQLAQIGVFGPAKNM